MKELTPEQIQENWKKLIGIINDTFEDDRLRFPLCSCWWLCRACIACCRLCSTT